MFCAHCIEIERIWLKRRLFSKLEYKNAWKAIEDLGSLFQVFVLFARDEISTDLSHNLKRELFRDQQQQRLYDLFFFTSFIYYLHPSTRPFLHIVHTIYIYINTKRIFVFVLYLYLLECGV